jgi:hypothetical protein
MESLKIAKVEVGIMLFVQFRLDKMWREVRGACSFCLTDGVAEPTLLPRLLMNFE